MTGIILHLCLNKEMSKGMKIIDLIKEGKPSISFEVFPPKKDSEFSSIEKAIREIADLKPGFMSVTYGAGGGTDKYTLDIAKEIERDFGVPTIAHVTCVSSTKETVLERIRDLKEGGIQNVMALRGDLAEEIKGDLDNRELVHAVQLVRLLRESQGDFCIGGACYPEVHPESPNQKTDLKYIKEKVDAGCDFLTTQMFFDNNLLYNFLYKLREIGVTVPVIPGIMPITKGNQVDRAIRLSGSHMPQRFKALVDKFGDDPDAMKQAGIAYATDQIIDLFANGINYVHVYTMNDPSVAKGIKDNLSAIIGKDF